ncbi:hypothetical protein IFR05_010280 [Cadophora sp. M221]|nr:hypothetical protein IFR05_010280 [Cadophora sp. M221]
MTAIISTAPELDNMLAEHSVVCTQTVETMMRKATDEKIAHEESAQEAVKCAKESERFYKEQQGKNEAGEQREEDGEEEYLYSAN